MLLTILQRHMAHKQEIYKVLKNFSSKVLYKYNSPIHTINLAKEYIILGSKHIFVHSLEPTTTIGTSSRKVNTLNCGIINELIFCINTKERIENVTPSILLVIPGIYN